MYNYVITAPGQGVQRPGMLDAWLTAVPQALERITEWSDIVGFDMVSASRDEVMLGDTAIAQPLIVAAALLSFELLRDRIDSADVLFAGHSVGELAAAAGAGYVSATTAITLAGARGAAMSAACAVTETGMAAVMPTKRDGASDAAIVAAVGAAGLTVANWNGSHQFVAAGTKDRIDAFIEARPQGLRIVPLTVAGAFHTDAMVTATSSFAKAAAEASFLEPVSAMVGNADGALIASPDDLRQRLIAQITAPVRWDLCAQTIAAHAAPDAPHLELAPAGPLTRLLERERPAARALAIRTPEDIDPTAEAA
ncbi:ACP S-malonyltransferase [Nocardia pseudovaccinii]|uniref:ACP S-malonyltransferase n=1 Tax=Nocardia pseudovaccinii TaxID=189540 RepID=UPI003D8A9F3B